jgi:hypothetical protein
MKATLASSGARHDKALLSVVSTSAADRHYPNAVVRTSMGGPPNQRVLHSRWQGESRPDSKTAALARADKPQRKTNLTACGSREELTKRGGIRVRCIIDPTPPSDYLVTEVPEVGIGAAE